MILPSKELLSEVLGDNYHLINDGVFKIEYYADEQYKTKVNLHELAHKCKEWARDLGYSITSGSRTDGTTRYDVIAIHKDMDIESFEDEFFTEIYDTETDGVFKAWEWIKENTK